MKPDFGATADDYRRYRAGFPDSLFERLGAIGIGRAGQEIVDLGTGSLARGFARRGRVCASGGVGGTLSEERVAAFDRQLESLLRERFPAEVLRVHHRVFAVVAGAPGRGDSPRT